ncbi:hypothetical protein AB0B28_14985 [Glycomyces sp. NPDC046736]|uniref:hypothetical protein n=1 Tax=Glycomyces sp. NPDC046736 TaxID=3155615 RepID=UPI0033FC4F0A
MRRNVNALLGAAGMAVLILIGSPATAAENEIPAPVIGAPTGLEGLQIDFGSAVAAPLSATTTTASGEIVVQDIDLPLGYCGGDWSWDYADKGAYQLDLTFGFSADCNFPPTGYPETDIGTEAALLSHDGKPLRRAPSGHGNFGFPAESIATVDATWPSSWHMTAEMSILLVQIDPKEPWVWVEVPPECQGAGTFIVYCQYETETLYIGNTPCGTGDSYSEPGGEMTARLTCSGDLVSVTGTVTDTLADGKCTYAMVTLRSGEELWEGVCDGGGTKSFSWPAAGEVVHAWLLIQ